DVATRRANDLLLAEKVDLLAMGTGSNIAKALSQLASQHKRLFVSYGTEAAELTGAEFFPTTFRCCLNTDMHSAELAVYFARLEGQARELLPERSHEPPGGRQGGGRACDG